MDAENGVEVIHEPPKPPSRCEVHYAIGVLDTFSFFAYEAYIDNLRQSTQNISKVIDKSFLVAKWQQVITHYFC